MVTPDKDFRFHEFPAPPTPKQKSPISSFVEKSLDELSTSLSSSPRSLKKSASATSQSIQPTLKEIIDEIPDLDIVAAKAPKFKPDLPQVDARLLLHIHADAFGGGTQLEGLTNKIAIDYLASYFKNERDPRLRELQRTLQTASELNLFYEATMHAYNESKKPDEVIQKAVEELREILIQKLQKEGAVGLPGGWIGKPFGHAIFYEIIKQNNGKYTLKLFNTGLGIYYHPSMVSETKQRYLCFQEYNDIDEEVLLSGETLRQLVEFRSCTKTVDGNATNYSEADIQECLIPSLRGKLNTSSNIPLSAYMSPQRSGTCSWKSLCAFVRSKITLQKYKRFKHDVKLQSLVEFYNQNKNSFETNPDPKQFLLFKESVEKFARHILKLSKKSPPPLSNEEIAWEKSWLKEALKTIFQGEEQLLKKSERNAPEVNVNGEVKAQMGSIALSSLKIQKIGAAKAPSLELFSEIKKWEPREENFAADLQRFREGLTRLYLEGHSHLVIEATNELLLKLPFPDDPLCKKLDRDLALSVMKEVAEITHLSFKSHFDIGEPQNESIIAILKGYALTHHLISIVNPRLFLKDFVTPAPLESSLEPPGYIIDDFLFSGTELAEKVHNPFFIVKDSLLASTLNRLSNYSKMHGDFASLFAHGTTSCQGAQEPLGDIYNPKRVALSQLLLSITKGLKKDDLSAVIDGASSIETDSMIRSAYGKESVLPKEFIELRKVGLIAQHFLKGGFILPPTFEKKEDSFELEVTYDKQRDRVTCSFKDVATENKSGLGLQECFHKRKIINPNLNKILHLIAHLPRPLEENKILTLRASDHGITLSDEEFHALLRLQGSDLLQVSETIHYFTDHLDRLDDQDYQAFFELMLFQDNNLNREIEFNEPFRETFSSFIKLGLDQAMLRNKEQTALFFVNLQQNLDIGKELCSLFDSNPCVELCQAILDHYRSIGDPSYILAARIFLNQHAAGPKTFKEEEFITERLKKELTSSHIQKALKLLSIEVDSDRVIIDISSGTLEIDKVTLRAIPGNITAHPHFIHLFHTSKFIAKSSSENHYTFENNAHTYKITLEPFLIEKEVDGKWLRYLPPALFAEVGSSILHAPSSSFWISEEEKGSLFVVDENKHRTIFMIDYEKVGDTINLLAIHPANDLSLTLAEGNLSFLSQFEDPSFIHLYEKEGRAESIDLPRFNLHFAVDGNKLRSKEFPGFYLASKQWFAPFGSFSHYLLLQNDEGESKILIPRQKLQKSSEGSLSTAVHFEKEPSEHQHFAAYSIDLQSGDLICRSSESSFLLALIYLAKHDYQKALSCLKPSARRFTSKELELLDQIITNQRINQDAFPKARAVRLMAAYLKFANEEEFTKSKTSIASQTVVDYINYLNEINNVGSLELKVSVEKTILKRLVQTSDQPLIRARYSYLFDHESSTEIDEGEDREEDQKLISIIPLIVVEMLDEKKSIPPALLTRPNERFIRDFHTHYRSAVAHDISPSLRLAINYAKQSTEPYVKETAILLEMVEASTLDLPLFLPSNEGELSRLLIKIARANAPSMRKLTSRVSIIPKKKAHKQPSLSGPLRASYLKSSPYPDIATYYLESKKIEALTPVSEDLLQELLPTGASDDSETTSLREELKVFKRSETSYSLKSDCDPEDFLINLTDQIVIEEEDALVLEKEMLALANRMPQEENLRLRRTLSLIGKKEDLMTTNDLIYLFTRGDKELFKERNPALSDKEISSLNTIIGRFLIKKTAIQKLRRAETPLNKLVMGGGENKESLIQEIGEQLFQARCFDPAKHPHFLVFEYASNLSLREDQVIKLEKFKGDNDSWPIMQMIMGSGKSKVLLPLLGLMLADGKKLSTVIVPEALLESTTDDLCISQAQAFSQGVTVLNFDRQTEFTVEELKNIKEKLEKVKCEKKCLITTSKSVQCLYLRAIESLNENPRDEKTKLMLEILKIFKEDCDVIIDEADTILNCRQQVTFSIGNRSQVKQERLQLVCKLYGWLLEIPHIPYNDQVKSYLAENFLDAWDIIGKEREQLKKYLMGEDVTPSNPKIDKDLLAIAKEEINTLLPLTLSRSLDINYGVIEGSPLAIPFKASNTPSVGSQFANTYETINYTIQTYLQKGVSLAIVEELVDSLKHIAMQEMLSSKCQINETKANQIFASLFDRQTSPTLFSFTHKELLELIERINEDPSLKLRFVETLILPQLTLFDASLKCTNQNLVHLFHRVRGFTGTLWNAHTFPKPLHGEPEADLDAYTITLLLNKKEPSIVVSKETPQKTEDLVEEVLKGVKASAIIDTGGVFKGRSNEEVAQTLLNKLEPGFKGIIFYNDKNELVILERGKTKPISLSDSSLPIEERFTFYDQVHTTGSNIKQKSDAEAVVTIGTHTQLRDLLQSVWRLRGLAKNQRPHFYVENEVAKTIAKDPLTLSDIIKFTIHNQGVMVAADALLSLKQKLRATLQNACFDVLAKEPQLFEHVRELFISGAKDTPFESFGSANPLVDTKVAIEREKEHTLKLAEKIFNHPLLKGRLPAIQKEIASLVKEATHLPQKAQIGSSMDRDCKIEVETSREMEVQLEQQREEKITLPEHISWTTLPDDITSACGPHLYSLRERGKLEAFSPNLFFSQNLFGNEEQLYTKDRKVPTELLILHRPPSQYQGILVDQKDASQLRLLLANQEEGPLSICLLDTNGWVVQQGQNRVENLSDPAVKMLLIQAKFYGGSLDYTKEELHLLKTWLVKNKPQLIYNYFKEKILLNQIRFTNTPLNKLFQELGVEL